MNAPDNEPFVYQARRAAAPMDKAMRRMALAAGVVSVVVIVVALLWSGVRATGFGPPPVITPPPGPLRTAPADPGGLIVPEADEPIMSSNKAAMQQSGQPVLAPEPAMPDVAKLDGTAAPAMQAAAAAVPARPVSVQLFAGDSEAVVQAQWAALQKEVPDLLAGKTPDFKPAIVDGKNIWRLRVGGFADNDTALVFCASLTAKRIACMLAPF